MLNEIKNEDFEREKLDPIAALIELYTNSPEEYIALSLAFCTLCYEFGYNNYQCYIANKQTPLTKNQKKILRPYTDIKEDSIEYIFDTNAVFLSLKNIIKSTSSAPTTSLNDALTIFEKHSADSRFICYCNKNYLAIREEIIKRS